MSAHTLRLTNRVRRSVFALFALLVPSAGAVAGQAAQPDLSTASIEELMNIEVTSASRKEQRAADVAAAIYVITNDDIRRSGLTSVPELLRLAPGVQVARIDASKWAVTIRGSNHRFSSKLLVLVDGRTMYTRQFSGVYWDTVNVLIEDIDRIEVVRGPGGAIWGANAVNGIINIITKSSVDTQGGFVRASVGTRDARSIAARYGGEVGGSTYRVYADSTQQAHTMLTPSTAADDEWTTVNAGARLDVTRDRDRVMVQTDIVKGDASYLFAFPQGVIPPVGGWPAVSQPTDFLRGSIVGRWSRQVGDGRSFEVQALIDATDRDEQYQHYESTAYDADLKYQARVGAHDLVSGVGFRASHERVGESFAVQYTPNEDTISVANVFVQDEIHLAADRLRLIAGAKVEHDTLAGWGVQPTGRALWTVTPRQRVWAAVSRALRTPSIGDRGVRANLVTFISDAGVPVVASLFGNPDYETEETISVEGGYRLEAQRFTIDASTFTSHHTRLPTLEPLEPQLELAYGVPHVLAGTQLTNFMTANASGLEIAGRWASAAWWRVDATYAFFHYAAHRDPLSRDTTGASLDGNTPAHQFSVRPSLSIGPRLDINAMVFHVSRLESVEVPAYTRTDARVEWKLDSHWSLSLTGQNLFGDPHAEFAGFENVTATTLMPRQIDGRLMWRF